MIRNFWIFLGLIPWLASASGCGYVDGDGTSGVIQLERGPLAGVLVQVHSAEGSSGEPLGSGVSGADGRFELKRHNARRALRLSPGEYLATIESVGEIAMIWPPEFRQPESSPLRFTLTHHDDVVELQVPTPATE